MRIVGDARDFWMVAGLSSGPCGTSYETPQALGPGLFLRIMLHVLLRPFGFGWRVLLVIFPSQFLSAWYWVVEDVYILEVLFWGGWTEPSC